MHAFVIFLYIRVCVCTNTHIRTRTHSNLYFLSHNNPQTRIICWQFRGKPRHYYAFFAHYRRCSCRFATGDGSFSDCSSYLLREEARNRTARGGQAKRRLYVSFENLISLIKVPTGFTGAHLPRRPSSSFFLSLFLPLSRYYCPLCVPDASRACGLAFAGVTRFIKLMKVFFWRWYAKQFYFAYPAGRCWCWRHNVWCAVRRVSIW